MNATTADTDTESMPVKRANAWAEKYNVTADFEFVPFSKSRNAKEKHPSLNWKVTLYKDKLPECARFSGEIMRFDYMQGSGHAPSYKPKQTYDIANAVKRECETGKSHRQIGGGLSFPIGKVPPPALADVLYSIASDCDAINYSSFEDWAACFGYETESRKAEAIYKTCLGYALKLRGAVGGKGLTELQDAVSDM